jgi:hypothetical protein
MGFEVSSIERWVQWKKLLHEIKRSLEYFDRNKNNKRKLFAQKAWTQSPFVDPEAFIISLINKENKPFKAMISSAHPYQNSGYNYYALYPSNGLYFGYDGHHGTVDISISFDSNANHDSYSNFGYAFRHQDYPAGSAKAQAILAGSQYFQTIEIEVFTKKNGSQSCVYLI